MLLLVFFVSFVLFAVNPVPTSTVISSGIPDEPFFSSEGYDSRVRQNAESLPTVRHPRTAGESLTASLDAGKYPDDGGNFPGLPCATADREVRGVVMPSDVVVVQDLRAMAFHLGA